MSVRRIKGSWYVDFRHDYERYRKKSPLNSKSGARAYETQLRTRLARGEPATATPPERQPTFRKFAAEWFETYVKTNNKASEQTSKESSLRVHLLPFFGGWKLADITAIAIERYKADKLRAGLAPKTINNHLTCLRKCLSTAVDWGRLNRCPQVKWLRVPPQEVRYLNAEEVGSLLQDAQLHWHPMLLTALRTGMRLGELLALEWHDVDLGNRVVHVRRSVVRGFNDLVTSTKSNRIRTIPLASDLVTLLEQHQHGGTRVFRMTNGKRPNHAAAASALQRLSTRVLGRRIGWHILRHTFATQLVSRGVPLRVIQKLLGHSSIAVTERYAHTAPTTLHRAVSLLTAPAPTNFGHYMGNGPELGPIAPTTVSLDFANQSEKPAR